MADKRDITLDVDEIQEVKNTDKKIVISRYIEGELMELSIEVRS